MPSGSSITTDQVELMERMNVVLEKQLETLIAIEQKMQGQTQITREATSAARDYTSAMDGMSTATGGLSDAFDQVGGYFDNFKDSVKKFVGSEAYDRITNGLNDGLDLLQINFSSLADIVSNPVAAAMGFLTSTWDILIKKAIELWKESLRIAEGLENIRDKFGSFAEKTSRDVKSAYSSFGSSIGGVGGKFAAGADGAIEKINTMIGLAEDLGPTIDLQGTNFKKAADNLYLLKEGLGFSAEGLKQMAVFANLGGKSVKQMSQETLATINKIGKGLGISTKVLGRDVSGAISNFKFLGRMTGDYVKEVTKAAVFTRKLGIELKELTGLVDKFDEFEGGAEAAAQLAQGFGMVLDPVKMLGMEAAPRLQELQRAFAATGRSFDTMSRQERKLLADTSGLTEEQAALAFSVRGMGMSYDQISKAGDKAAESQKSTAEVAREVLDNIKNVFADIGEITGFITAFFEGFGRGFMGEGSVLSLLHKLVGGMQTVRSIGYEVGRMFATMLFRSEGAETNGKAILAIFERIGQMFVSVAGHIRTFVDELKTDPTKAMKNFLTNIFNTMESLFSGEGIDLNGMAERLGTLFLEIMTGAIEWLTDKLGEWTEKLTELFADEKKGVAGGTENALTKALGKLTDSVPKLLEKIGPFLEALIKAIPKIIEKFPIATLFVAGGPIATALTGIAGGFFTALGGIFGTVGSSAAAAGAVATGGSAAGGTGGLTAGTTSAMTGAATAVVGQSQGILDKLFDLIKEPAKITLMATAIAASIQILGEAVREVFLAFMDPLPGRPESFIDIVVKSAKKFESVSMGNLVALGATMLAVGVVIGGLAAAISYMASNLSGKQIALIAGGAGLAVAGLSLLPKGGTKGLIGTVLGNIGDLMRDITAPFTDPTFLAGLDTMSTMSDKLSSLKATADSLKEMVAALTALEGALPKKTLGFGKNVDDLRKGISDAVSLLIGVPGSEGVATMLQKLPDMSNFADKAKGIGEISKAMTSLGQIVSTTSSMGDLAGSKTKILELVGENGFLSYFRVLPSWFNWAASTPLADNVIDQINSLTRALTTLKSAITALANLKISGGIMGGGATAQAAELMSFLPTVRSMTNSMNEQLGSLEFLEAGTVDTKIQGIEKMMSILETYADKMNRVSMSLSSRKLQQFEARVIAVVEHLRTVRTILEELPKISLDASINRLESDMQVAKQTLTLKGGAVNISVEMNVSMNAQKMADQLIIEGFVSPNMQYEQYINPTVFGQGYQSGYSYVPTNTGAYGGYAAASAAGGVGGGAPSGGGAP